MSVGASDHSATSLIAVSSVLLGISISTLILRFYARHRQNVPLLADDWLTLPGLAAFMGACGALWFGISIKSLGYSTGDFPKEYVQKVAEHNARSQYALNILSTICLSCTKASALLFYRRIFCVSGRKAAFNVILVASVVVQVLWMAIFTFLVAFECRTHFDAQWTGQQVKYCTSSYPILEGQAISGFILDFWVLLLPIYPISQVHTTKVKKLAIGSIFLLACLGFGSSIARMVITIRLVNLGIAAVHHINPQQHQSRAVFYWMVEMGISVICINLPSIWMLLVSKPPDAVLRSMRSVISLVSVASRGSKSPRELPNCPNAQHLEVSNKSKAWNAPMQASAMELDTCESGDLEALTNTPVDQIRANRSVEQSSVSRLHDDGIIP